jgi:hypothetical protein
VASYRKTYRHTPTIWSFQWKLSIKKQKSADTLVARKPKGGIMKIISSAVRVVTNLFNKSTKYTHSKAKNP